MVNLYKVHGRVTQSANDTRAYRGLTLENGIKCLLISDPSTDRSACAVDVNVGHLLDPAEFPGLAHFCEHMLFMGSSKYPVENEYSKFIKNNAGASNAYTSAENTNYRFEVAPNKLKEALDIFAQFFISPLFNASSVDREILAVDAENQKNLQNDGWRLYQLEKATCRPDHPYSKFGTGSLITLKTDPAKLGLNARDALISFHNKYYSSNLMSLCMLGTEPLDQLEQYAVEHFSPVPNKNLARLTFPSDPFAAESFANLYSIVPVADIRRLSIIWQIPDLHHYGIDSKKPSSSSYISHMISHEGKGSLLSQLKSKGWCNNISAEESTTAATGFSFFAVKVDLTEEGTKHTNEILAQVYQCIFMLRSQGAQQWVYEELEQLRKISFDFKDKEQPSGYVAGLAKQLQKYVPEDVLYPQSQFEPQLVEELLDCLTPEKMLVFVVSKEFQNRTDQVEKWYGTQYSQAKFTSEQLERLRNGGFSSDLSMPEKNAFIPQDLTLVKHETQDLPQLHPRVIESSPLARLWFKEDTKFLLPRAIFMFEIRNPLAYHDPVHANMTALFKNLLDDSLTEETSPAALAGLRYTITPNNYGLEVSLSGFSDKMHILLDMLVKRMANLVVSKERFEILKENYMRALRNCEADQPYSHAMYYLALGLAEKGWSKQQLLETINDFSMEDLQAFIPKLLTQGMFINAFAYGNLTQARAIEFSSIVQKTFESAAEMRGLQTSQTNHFRQFQLPQGTDHVFMRSNCIHKTCSIEVYFQVGVMSTRNNAMVELFCQIIKEASFNVLRTKEQLGYIVDSGVHSQGGVNGVIFVVQSDRSPAYLDERIENFIYITKETLNKMTDVELKVHADALALAKLEEPKKMSAQAGVYWAEISSRLYDFDRQQLEVAELKSITKEQVIEFFEKNIMSGSDSRRKLAVYVHPPEINAELTKGNTKGIVIEDLNKWQRSLFLYPLPEPRLAID